MNSTAILETRGLHKNFGAIFRPTTPEEFVKTTKETLANKFAFLDRHLAKNQYLTGDKFTVADAYCFVIVGWSKYKDIDLGRWLKESYRVPTDEPLGEGEEPPPRPTGQER